MRANIYKEKVLAAFKNKHLLSIADIHMAIPNADYSTVFRNVDHLVKEGVLKKVVIDQRSTVYELGTERHDHFICNSCGVIEAMQGSSLRERCPRKIISDIVARGICDNCNT